MQHDHIDDIEPVKVEKKSQQGHVALHSTGFRDFLLKSELLRAVVDAGFEHPSEVQHRCLPQAMLGTDLLCQAKSGMGKTAVFVLALLQQIEPIQNTCQALILAHTRDLSYQISKEFLRFSKYLPDIKVSVFYGGIDIKIHQESLKSEIPNIVVGSPGRILQLVKEKKLDISSVKHFVLDECDHILDSTSMRKTVQDIFKHTPKDKQVMMFTATLNQTMKDTAKKFMQSPMEILVDESKDLDLRGLQQYIVKVQENEKNRKLTNILDHFEFNQVIIFVKTASRAHELNKLLTGSSFPSICVHGELPQEERKKLYEQFKKYEKRILVSTDIFARGIDFERVNMVINYDMPMQADVYLHRIARAGRFGTKGIAISFVLSDGKKVSTKGHEPEHSDEEILAQAQKRFTFKIESLPDKIDPSTYMTA